MTGALRGLSKNPRDGIWVYRRAIPKRLWHIFDKKNYIQSMKTHDQAIAKREWASAERLFQREIRRAELKVELSGPNGKQVRRRLIWSAIARWLHEYSGQHGGHLPLPKYVEIPIHSRITSHPFEHVRDVFTQWAAVNEPDAVLLLHTADSTQGALFFMHALVGAYFIVREMLDLGPKPNRAC